MARDYPRIKDAYPDACEGDGVFTDLASFDMPWADVKSASALDLLYINHSGEKIQARIVRTNVNTYGVLDATSRALIAQALYNMYAEPWAKLWDTMTIEYSPIENYRMTETETTDRDGTTSGTDTGTVSHQGTDTETHTGTDTDTHTGTNTTVTARTEERGIYGFDSASASDSDSADIDETVTDTKNLTDTRTLNLTDGTQRSETETRNLASAGTHSDTEERELTRYGNIGVTTSQQMITAEREVWQWLYFEHVFNDIDKVIALQTY